MRFGLGGEAIPLALLHQRIQLPAQGCAALRQLLNLALQSIAPGLVGIYGHRLVLRDRRVGCRSAKRAGLAGPQAFALGLQPFDPLFQGANRFHLGQQCILLFIRLTPLGQGLVESGLLRVALGQRFLQLLDTLLKRSKAGVQHVQALAQRALLSEIGYCLLQRLGTQIQLRRIQCRQLLLKLFPACAERQGVLLLFGLLSKVGPPAGELALPTLPAFVGVQPVGQRFLFLL